jgi:DUF4097 and DUF4098 domain-containing protein YvlB
MALLLLLGAAGCASLAAREVVAGNLDSPQGVKVAPGCKVAVSNQFEFGSVVVTGWDSDVVQAAAISRNAQGPLPVRVARDLSDAKRILVTTAPEGGGSGSREVRLEVRVPRYVELEVVHGPRAEVEVTDVQGSVAVSSGSGSINVQRIGSLKARSGSGDLRVSNVAGSVSVQKGSGTFAVSDVKGSLTVNFDSGNARIADIGGLIEITTSTGNVGIKNAESDVRVISINGNTNILCTAGRVEVRDTSGVITLAGVKGDVDVTTSNGRATFTGIAYAERRYRLKTLSGSVHMAVSDVAAGFAASLSSYSGSVETDFELKGETSPQAGRGNRRVVGTYGEGRSRIELDSFNGRVRLSKIASNAIEKCER